MSTRRHFGVPRRLNVYYKKPSDMLGFFMQNFKRTAFYTQKGDLFTGRLLWRREEDLNLRTGISRHTISNRAP